MRTLIFLLSSLLVFAAFNYAIWEKEEIKKSGETVYLELAPVDPRSLIQGDYMRLRYAIENAARYQRNTKGGYLVISLDNNRVAKFVRVHDKETLAVNEKLIHFHTHYGQIRIAPDSFMFQEGHAEYYRRAKYGIFKFDNSNNYILVGLADDQLKEMNPEGGSEAHT